MSPAAARLRAGLLLCATIQFAVLVTLAMWWYAERYDFTGNFLSELGATRTWAGRPNHASAGLWMVALAGLGLALVAFAGAWRTFAFSRGRARAAGIAAQISGTASGAAFVAIAVAPVNRVLDLHNALVVIAFALLLAYAAAMTVLEWRNAGGARKLASLAYLVVFLAYVFVAWLATRAGVTSPHGRALLVISQKAMVGASLAYIAYFTIAVRRQLAATGTDRSS